MKLEALIPVLKGEMPLKAHAHRADDICTAIRIAREFGVKMTLEHCTEGHLIPDIVAVLASRQRWVLPSPTPARSSLQTRPSTPPACWPVPGSR